MHSPVPFNRMRQGMLLLLVSVLLGTLSGCGAGPARTSPDSPIVLEFWTLQLRDFADVLNPMFRQYEATHPDTRIEWVDLPFAEGEKRALTAMMSPHVPDVINLNPDFSALLATRNALVDMNIAVPNAVKSRYVPVVWDACTLQSSKTLGSQPLTFGLPWYVTSQVTLYHQGLLKQAGVRTVPTDMIALSSLAAQLRTKIPSGGAYAMMPNLMMSGNFLKWLHRNGVPLYDARGRAVFADHGAEAHLTPWVRLYQQHGLPPETLVEGPRAAVDRYQSGTLALLTTGHNLLAIVAENAPDVFQQTSVAPQFPARTTGVDFATMVLVVPKKSVHPKEAVDFAQFMTNAANQLALAQRAPVLPSVTSALQSPYFQQHHAQDVMARARSLSARQLLRSHSAYQIRPKQKAINNLMDYYVQRAMLGKDSPKAAMQQAQLKINDLYLSPAAVATSPRPAESTRPLTD